METSNQAEPTKESYVLDSKKSNNQTCSTNGIPLEIDNLEHFPTEILLSIFAQTDDIDLLHLALISTRFESMVRELFAERYAEKYFVIEGESVHHQTIYSALFSLFGDNIGGIEANGIRHIDNDHWLVQLLNSHTPNLEKLYFKKCSFKNVDHLLSQNMNITHLTFRGGSCEENYRIKFPEYNNLRSMELVNFSHISKPSLEKVLHNNPQMERLVLKCCDHYFTLSGIMELVYTHLTNLKELNILDCYNEFGQISLPVSLMDQFVGVLISLESFGMTIINENTRDLLRRVSSTCKGIKQLELYNYECEFYRREFVNQEIFCLFDKVETLSLLNCSLASLASIVEILPNLRYLSISKIQYCPNDLILTILRKCKHLEKLIIEPYNFWCARRDEDETIYRKNVHFHDEFIKAIRNPHTRLEFKEKDEVIGVVTKDEIIWRNKLLHWVGYDPIYSQSNVRLLDLANVSEGVHKHPLNLIFNYLDLDSLYSFSMASENSKQLVHNYIQHRCKSSPKYTEQLAVQLGKFYVIDEFSENFKGLQMFGKCMKHLEVNLLNYNHYHLQNIITEHCKVLTTLSFHTRQNIDLHYLRLPNIRHLIFYGYANNFMYNCDLSYLSQQCPNLEILEIKTVAKLNATNQEKPHSFSNLQKIIFKPLDDFQVEYAREIFKKSGTEVIIDY